MPVARRSAAAASQGSSEPPDLKAQARGALMTTAERVVASVREIRERTQNFPPLRITRPEPESDLQARISVAMGPSPTFSLNHCLRIFVLLQLLSPDSSALKISVYCTCQTDSDAWPDGVEWTTLFAGAADAMLLAQRLEELLHIAMDQAQSLANNAPIRLPIWREE